MNLADVLMGSLVFGLASTSALQLSMRTSQSLLQQRQQAEQMEQIDLALLAGEQALRQAGYQRPNPDPACANPAAVMISILNGAAHTPLPTGLSRQVTALNDRQVSLAIIGAGAGIDRQRLLSPGAYGLCPAHSAPAPSNATTSEESIAAPPSP